MTSANTTITRADVGLRSERGPILLSLMLATALVALDSTIIATAVPTIVDDFGGFSQFPWLFSIYLLTQAVSVPIYGKLADIVGRKPIMIIGIALFAIGSILCGLAWNMLALIIFRALQGLGAGAVMPMSVTIAGDLYSTAERAVAQGYLASVWGISSVVGPALGGLFTEYLSWRLIFWVNIPLCALAAWILLRAFKEKKQPRETKRIDYLGAGTLTIGCALIILALLEGGHSWAWASGPSYTLFIAGFLLLVAFVFTERRAQDPVLPLWIAKRRVLVGSCLASASVGAILLGLTSYVPTFVQSILGHGPLVAGFALATLTIGWPLATSQAGKLYLRIGFRATGLIGVVFVIAGTVALSTLGMRSTAWEVAIFCFVVGLGMGLIATPTLIAAQGSVSWSDRGVVTGANMFSRAIGSSVGVAAFGAIVTAGLAGRPESDRFALSHATHLVFVAVAVVAVLMVGALSVLPRHVAEQANAK